MCAVGSVQKRPRRPDGQAGIDGPRRRRFDLGRRARAVVPGGDGPVQIGKDEAGGTAVHEKGRGAVVDLAGWPLGSAGRSGDGDLERNLTDNSSRHPVERGEICPLIRDPERARGALGNTPGVLQVGVGDRGQPGDVRNEIRLRKGGGPGCIGGQHQEAQPNQNGQQSAVQVPHRRMPPVQQGIH